MDVICLTPQTEIFPKIPAPTPQEIANISETQLLNLSMTGGPATPPPKQMATKKGRPKGAVKPKAPKAKPIAPAGDVGKLKEKHAANVHHHPNHPPWADMMVEAVTNLHHRGGSSVPAIKKYITSTFTIDNEKITPLLRRGAKAALTSKKLKQVKGKGLSGSFKLPPNGAHTKTILGNKKPKSAKKTKLAKAKNPAARKKIVKDSTKTATGEKKVKKAIKIKPAKGKISKKPKKTPTATKKKVEPGTKIPAENIALDASLAEPIPMSTNVTPKTKKAVIKPKTAPKPKKVAKKALAPKSAGIKVKLATPKKAKIKSAKSLKSRKAPKPKTTMKLGAPKVAATGGAKKK